MQLDEQDKAVASLALLSTAVAACGGGGGSDAAPAPPPTGMSAAEASRLLAQASFGANRAEVDRVKAMGVAAWLDEQFSVASSQGHVDWMRAQGYEASTYINSRVALD